MPFLRAGVTQAEYLPNWAELAVHINCYLQKGIVFHFNIGDMGFYKGP